LVSSTRINEFAEASRARNVVIVLDCCYAGAFRGGDFGDAVAGPGRYVLASCRGTQLANDATVDNGTSYFTQHLVEGLLGEAIDRDRDGFVDFSDLYAYVDQRLRAEGKQIPQRRVDGDGDLRLAKAARRVSEIPDATASRASSAARASNRRPPHAPESAATAAPAAGSGWTRRHTVLAATAAAVLAVTGAVVAVVLAISGGGSADDASPGRGSYSAPGPWRIRIDGTTYGHGCTVALTETTSGTPFTLPDRIYEYEIAQYQIPQAGKFTWTTTDRRCLVTPKPGMGNATLPLLQERKGDTDAFAAPPHGLRVKIIDNRGNTCTLRLFNSSGQELDTVQWHPGDGDVTLDTTGTTTPVYVFANCVIRLTTPP